MHLSPLVNRLPASARRRHPRERAGARTGEDAVAIAVAWFLGAEELEAL